MRGKKHDVCHTCRQHKIGCDGVKPICSQCRLTGRKCGGYLQDLVVFHHKPTPCQSRSKKKKTPPVTSCAQYDDQRKHKSISSDGTASSISSRSLQQPTYEECVAILVHHYIPKDEIPFLSYVEPSKSRICGGWVQALPHVSQSDADFGRIILPAVRALTMAMVVTGSTARQEYLNTYGSALQGIRTVLDGTNEPIGSGVAIASMCLALSEVLVPTSYDGYQAHLRGVAAMMQSCGPYAFKEGVAHLMFVGVRPLIIIDAINRRKPIFLMEAEWQTIPFSVHHASGMQILLGHAAAIAPLLEAIDNGQSDCEIILTRLSAVLSTLQIWEDDFLGEETLHRPIAPNQLDLSTDSRGLPDPCFTFVDVSHANFLSHCWAFRLVCLLQISELETQSTKNPDGQKVFDLTQEQRTKVTGLCTSICRALPYLLQTEMRLYGSMSAGYPLDMVSKCLRILQLRECRLADWCAVIEEQVHGQRIALCREMAESGALTQLLGHASSGSQAQGQT